MHIFARFLAVFLAVFVFGFLHALSRAVAQDVELDEILVTAGRTPVEQSQSGQAATIISGAQLEQSQTRYLADALRQVPGIHVSRVGSFGGKTELRLRGAEANHVLVLIDGVEVSELSDGAFDFGSLQVADIDKIEILRGPQSAFWGADALGGVINIITKSGQSNGYEVTARSELGSDGTALGVVGVKGGTEWMDLALSAAYRETNGFNISDFGREEDGDENWTLNGKITLDVTPDFQLTGTIRYVDRISETDGQDFAFGSPTYGRVLDTDDITATQELFGAFTGAWQMLDGRVRHKFGVQAGETQRQNDGQSYASADKGQRLKAFHQTTLAWQTPQWLNAAHQFTAGYEFERETYRQLPPIFDPSQLDTQTRNLHGFVGEYRGVFDERFFLNAAIRHDVNDQFEDATTFHVDGAYLIPTTQTRLHAALGTGIKNPTFYEQFGFTPSSFIGNPDLQPEHSFGWDVGVEQALLDGKLTLDVTYFQQDLQDEIETIFTPSFMFTAVNLDGISKRRGVEVAATFKPLEGLKLTGSYTYTHSEDGDDNREARRPYHAAAFSAHYQFLDDRAGLFADIIYNGEMDDIAYLGGVASTVRLDDYVVVNVGGRYRLNEHVEIYGRVENLFDQEYEEIFDYNSPGLTAFIGGKITFGGP